MIGNTGGNVRHNSRFITLAGGILAFFCFVLPWKHIYTGAVLANGRGWTITLAFIASLMIGATGYYLYDRKSPKKLLILFLSLFMICIGVIFSVLTLLLFFQMGINFVTMSFVASLVIIVTTIYMLNKQTPRESISTLVVLISSIVGLCCFLILFFSGSQFFSTDNRVDNTKYGASLSAIGFILSLIGLLCFPKLEVSSGVNHE